MALTVIVDYGMGNIKSVAKAVAAVSGKNEVAITSDPKKVEVADRVVFPGQGAMSDCLRELDARGLREIIKEAARNKPFLGICIGLQMLFEFSEENGGACLNLFKGKVVRFANGKMERGRKLKVPHMGWNNVRQESSHPIWKGIPDNGRFYFVHSYFVSAEQKNTVFGSTYYSHWFDSAVGSENVFAVQFHPEKSQALGLRLLSNFVNWDGCT
ncbi:MAG: imidazole glycerol phosphate synthase subunit HisH [Proteobacteria bacterium]|nr:imidazole glycerol phosphate synthase subunit HisH [Pseudomonadota bacterium]